ncbi:MAG: PAS domain-containing protein, partial [Kiritimatiellia bacterium]|nr:PAS domain-containing protein [Kiritimatiellia bacterium]
TRAASFRAFARQQTYAIHQELVNIRNRLDALSRLFQANQHLTENAFSLYASRFNARHTILASLWLPDVPEPDRTAFETAARRDGLEGYRIWQFDEQMRPVPAAGRALFHPIRYLEPLPQHAAATGFDMGSEPFRAAALRDTRLHGFMTASEPITLFAATNRPTGFFIFNPVRTASQTGTVAFAVSVDSLLHSPLNQITEPGYRLTVDLFYLEKGRSPRLIGSSDPAHSLACAWGPAAPPLTFRQPLLHFGKAYALVVHPSSAWLAAYPVHHALTVAVGGSLFSLLFSLFILFLSERQIRLEREINRRTLDLQIAKGNAQSVLRAAPVAMMVVDREAKLLNANDRAVELFHSHAVEAVNRPCGVFLRCVRRHDAPAGCGHGPDCSSCPVRRAIRRVMENNQGVTDQHMETVAEYAGKTRVFHLRFSAAPVTYNGERQVLIALHDITSWHQTERLYQSLFTEMHYGFALHEIVIGGERHPIDFQYKTANPAFERLTGIPVGTLPKQTLLTVFPDFPQDILAALVSVVHSGEAQRFSFFLPSVGKHFEGTAFRTEHGQMATIFTDVTDRKQAEEQARNAAEETLRLLNETEAARHDLLVAVDEQKLADEALIYERNLLYALMDNLPDRIYFKDAESRFIKISKAHAASLKLAAPEQAIGKTDADFKPPDVAEEVRARERQIIETGIPLLAQVEQKTGPDGRPRWVSASKVPIRDASGKIVGLVGISRDITREIELQQELQQASKMDAIGRLAGGVAHDFNNLLQAILGFTEILLLGVNENDPQYGDLKEIERAARRAADLTRQLLAFSRKQRIEPQLLDLNQIILGTEKMLQRLIGENIEILLSLDPAVKAVSADPNQIEQILMNLAVNAKDAMRDGGRMTFHTETVTLTPHDAELFPESVPGTYTCLSVTDNGCGIAPELLPHLFEPFFTTKERGKGTGLGLSVIYGIVKQNGGWISVYSEPGHGTTFKIYLPAQEGSPESNRPDSAPDTYLSLEGLGKTILLVEDEPGVRNLASVVLQSAGYHVFSCESAESAKTLFERERARIDLLFSDVVLVGQNGIDLAHELRVMTPSLPVLLCSGYADDTVRWSAIQQEGFHFLPKPYPTAKLLAAVSQIFRSTPSSGTGAESAADPETPSTPG